LFLPLQEGVGQALKLSSVQPKTAAPGSDFFLSGSNFNATASNNTVSFTPVGGGTATNATSVTLVGTGQKLLKVTVPNSLQGGNYTLQVTRASDNSTATLTDLFSVTTGGGDFAFDSRAPNANQDIISTNVDSPQSVYAADMDGDGDMDVLSASPDDNKIAWYANDGTGGFGTQQVISTAADGAESVYAADMDGDGDMDALSASDFDKKIAWYENDGTGGFGFDPGNPSSNQNVISTEVGGAKVVSAADLDGDGDMDVLAASISDDKIAWYENNGTGDFGFDSNNPSVNQNEISTVADGAQAVFAADVDGDGDMDVLSASREDDKIAWYENTDGTGGFGPQQVISTASDGPISLHAADFEGDGDIDVLSASQNDNKIAWYANDGTGGFGTQQVISTEVELPTSAYATDLDADGDVDILSTSQSFFAFPSGGGGVDKISLFKNKTSVQLTGNEGWRMLSVPSRTASYADLLDPIWTQGIATGADATNGSPNVFKWFGSEGINYQALTDLTTQPTPGTGFIAYVFSDDDFNGTPEGFPKTLTLEGDINSGGITPPINTDPGGFTLLGNPYSSTIDSDLLTLSDVNAFTGIIYVWNPNNAGGKWETWNGSVGDLTNGLIGPYQGFFIENSNLSAERVVVFDVDDKVEGDAFRGKTAAPFAVRFDLKGEELGSTAWLNFSEDGSLTKRVRGDALKMEPLNGSYVQLGTNKPGLDTLLDINHLPAAYTETVEIPMPVLATKSGSYTLQVSEFNLPEGVSLSFNNLAKGESIPMGSDFETTLEVTADQQPKASAEALVSAPEKLQQTASSAAYSITIEPDVITSVDDGGLDVPSQVELRQNFPNPFNPSTTIQYALPAQSRVNLTVYDMLGQRVATLLSGQVQSAGSHSVNFDASNLSSGVYIYRLQTGSQSITRKMILLK